MTKFNFTLVSDFRLDDDTAESCSFFFDENEELYLVRSFDTSPRVSTFTPMHLAMVPAKLCRVAQWVNWRGKKVPVQPDGMPASSTDSDTWHTFHDVVGAMHRHDGIGFVFSADDDFLGIDLDGCRNPSTGILEPWASAIVERFPDAYVEVSPSKTGVKIFCVSGVQLEHGLTYKVPEPDKYGKKPAIEIYSQGRFFAVTGEYLPGYERMRDCTDAVGQLVEEVKAKKDAPKPKKPEPMPYAQTWSDMPSGSRVIDRARAYIAKMPSAISGQRGHDATYAVALAVYNGFALDERDAWQLLCEYNQTCRPPWSQPELRHKLADAQKQGAITGRGYLLDGGSQNEKNTTVLDKTPKNIEKNEVLSRIDSRKSRKTTIPERLAYVPFPSKELPKPLADYIEQLSEEMCCDASFVALPLLAGLAAAIGNRATLRLRKSWRVPSVLWCVVVAGSGSVKSAPAKKALEPLDRHQMRLLKAYDEAMSEHEKQMIEYEKDLAEYKRSKENLQVPEQPVAPILERVVINDTTIEALGARLNDNPKGLLVSHDELSAWFCSFERYSKSNDSAKWLEFYSASQSIIDRAKSPRPHVIPRAFVGVTGTIQPGVLRKHLTSDYKSSGLAARLLFAMPPKQVKQWPDSEVEESVEKAVADIFDKLLAVEMPVDDDGNPFPATVIPDTTALDLFKNYYNRHNRESVSLDEDLGAAYAKLEEVAARLALVIHCVRYALGEVNSLYSLDVASMAAGIELTEWFKQEAKRVYAVLADDDVAFENRQVIQWIEAQGRPVTIREVYRAHRNKFQSQEEVELLLNKMVREGVATSETDTPTEQGGRPVTTYSLSEFGHNPENPRENRGSVQNSVVEIPKPEEWKP